MDGEAGQSYLERSRSLLNHDPPGQQPARTQTVPEPHRIVGMHLESDSPAT